MQRFFSIDLYEKDPRQRSVFVLVVILACMKLCILAMMLTDDIGWFTPINRTLEAWAGPVMYFLCLTSSSIFLYLLSFKDHNLVYSTVKDTGGTIYMIAVPKGKDYEVLRLEMDSLVEQTCTQETQHQLLTST